MISGGAEHQPVFYHRRLNILKIYIDSKNKAAFIWLESVSSLTG